MLTLHVLHYIIGISYPLYRSWRERETGEDGGRGTGESGDEKRERNDLGGKRGGGKLELRKRRWEMGNGKQNKKTQRERDRERGRG